MMDFVKLEICLKEETIQEMDELIAYCKFRKKYTGRDLPVSYEEVIKAALYDYLLKIEVIYNNVISEKKYKLKGNGNLKNNLKVFTEELGLKNKDICELTGIDPGSVSHIFSNRNQPSMDYFLRIWVVLGCPPIEHVFYRESD